MSGGSVNHGRLAIRLLENSGCITGNSDIKLNIVKTADYTYPDASVTCDHRDQNTPNYFTYPCLVVEVLSNSTEAYDRGGKFKLYQSNPALRDYLLVSSTRIEMDLYHKNENGDWLILTFEAGDMVTLKSIDLSFPIEQVYRGISLQPPDR
ncbi:MAG: Uma2 family endonuclease [Phormidesmis sp.]